MAGQPRGSGEPWLKRLAWLVSIWCASVLALGIVAYAIRVLMQAVGLHS